VIYSDRFHERNQALNIMCNIVVTIIFLIK